MKLIFDQNISFRAVKQLQHTFTDAKHVSELQLNNVEDSLIWKFAKEQQYTIVTFDADFYDLVTLYGHPPKIIWLRLGNTTTQNLITSIKKHEEIITAFINDKNYNEIGCLEIDN